MSRKNVIWGSLILVLLGQGATHAQAPAVGYGGSSGPITETVPGSAIPVGGTYRSPSGLSPWIAGENPDCCGTTSTRNPLQTELYLRFGFAVLSGDGALAESLDSGWSVQGGGRALFFNDLGDAAWTVDLGVININNPVDGDARTVNLLNFPFASIDSVFGGGIINEALVTAKVGALNRTAVNLGIGREYYLYGGASGTRDTPNPAMWRAGFDGGGRWGTAKLQLRDLNAIGETLLVIPQKRRLTDTIGALYFALHTDVDVPCGCCIFQAGFRAEVDYTWSDILQAQNKSDVVTTNLMFNLGVRY